MFEAGRLEIYRFVPPSLLPNDVGELEVEDFLRLIAKARYVQKLESDIITRGIAEAFKE